MTLDTKELIQEARLAHTHRMSIAEGGEPMVTLRAAVVRQLADALESMLAQLAALEQRSINLQADDLWDKERQLAESQARVAELEKDRERWDFVEAQHRYWWFDRGPLSTMLAGEKRPKDDRTYGNTARAAVDVAIAEDAADAARHPDGEPR